MGDFGLYLFLRRLKEAIRSRGDFVDDDDDAEAPDFLLLDDERLHRCTIETSAWHIVGKKRTEAVLKAAAGPGPPIVVVEDHPYYLLQGESPRLFRLAVETGQVPRRQRKGLTHLVVSYTAPENPYLREDVKAPDELDVFSIQSCDVSYRPNPGAEEDFIGKRFRHWVTKTIVEGHPKDSRVLVRCICWHYLNLPLCDNIPIAIQRAPYAEHQRFFARSRFCLITAGDAASSRRLADAMAGGCIPVFLGPPWHTFPYLPYIDYTKFSVLVRFRDVPFWNESTPELTPTLGFDGWFEDHARDPRAFFLKPGHPAVQELDGPSQLVSFLKSIPLEEVQRLKRGVREVIRWFVASPPPVGTDAEIWDEDKVYAGNLALAAACDLMDRAGMMLASKPGRGPEPGWKFDY